MEKENNWCIYLLECNDGSYYCGITNNIEKRIEKHNNGKGAKYTKARLPVKLIFATNSIYSKSDASKIEYETKQKKKNDKIKFLETKKQ